jgi:hypothetical protein
LIYIARKMDGWLIIDLNINSRKPKPRGHARLRGLTVRPNARRGCQVSRKGGQSAKSHFEWHLKPVVNNARPSRDVLESSRSFADALGLPTRSTRPLYGVHGDRHDAAMQLPWQKSRDIQLDLLDQAAGTSDVPRVASPHPRVPPSAGKLASPATASLLPLPPPPPASPATVHVADGRPLNVAISRLQEDADNPRTEFADVDLDFLVQDIRARGILQPIVVHPADAAGRYRIHFGALRLRAAQQAGLLEVPVVVRDATADPYAQVAENLMRHALSPIDIARFIKGRVDAGESNVTIAKMDRHEPDERGASPHAARTAAGT